MSESQRVWIQEARKGNELAAYNLYESYSKAMYNTLIRVVCDEEAAKDLLQEAFVKAFKNLENLTNEVAFAGWLKRIVVNIGLEYVRKKNMYLKILMISMIILKKMNQSVKLMSIASMQLSRNYLMAVELFFRCMFLKGTNTLKLQQNSALQNRPLKLNIDTQRNY